MLCSQCHKELPKGRVLCPGCSCLNPYNITGYGNTKAVQTLLSTMIREQHASIADTGQFIAVMYDYLADYPSELKLLKKALNAGFLDVMIGAEDKRTAFRGLRNRLVKAEGFGTYEAEFVMACFAHMLGFSYVSPMIEYDDAPAPEKAAKEKDTPEPRVKTFGKLDAFKFVLSGRATVKEGYTELAAYCFENNGVMRDVSLPSTLRAIGEYAFSDCKKLESVTIPAGIRKMEKGLFSACVGLKRVIIPEGVLSIGDNCFLCCTSLGAMRIPESVSSIGENAFSGCSALERIVVPKNVKFIDTNAFAYCGKLTVICIENSFTHKYCMQNGIKYQTMPAGAVLPDMDELEGKPDE